MGVRDHANLHPLLLRGLSPVAKHFLIMSGAKSYLVVDGHSVIFQLPDLRACHQRQPRLARLELQARLARLHDSGPWLVTLVFDGRQGGRDPAPPGTMPVIYSTQHQSADSIIERLVASAPDPRRVHVVTADHAEALTVEAHGATVHSPLWLEETCRASELDFQATLQHVRKNAQW
jgi:predicted RNA-binding protein with PIN domain